MLEEVVKLILAGNENQACRLFLQEMETETVNYLTLKLGWDADEARILLHDAYFLIEGKIKDGQVTSINKTYIKGVCRNLGSNVYKRNRNQDAKFKNYLQEVQHSFQHDVFEKYGIELYEEGVSLDEQKVLRAYNLLGEQCKKIIMLKYIQGCSHTEVVKHMDSIKNESSSRAVLSQCVKRCRQYLKKIKEPVAFKIKD